MYVFQGVKILFSIKFSLGIEFELLKYYLGAPAFLFICLFPEAIIFSVLVAMGRIKGQHKITEDLRGFNSYFEIVLCHPTVVGHLEI